MMCIVLKSFESIDTKVTIKIAKRTKECYFSADNTNMNSDWITYLIVRSVAINTTVSLRPFVNARSNLIGSSYDMS